MIVDIEGDEIIKTELPTEPDDKDESIKPYVILTKCIFFFFKKKVLTKILLDQHFLLPPLHGIKQAIEYIRVHQKDTLI